MNSYRYDLHLHSCLSPCGDTDMTPNNIVNMAALLGCDIIDGYLSFVLLDRSCKGCEGL